MRMIPETGSAAVAIIRCTSPTDTILVLRRAPHPQDPWSGHFAFPGGRRDAADENLFSTCVRETMEETGISLQQDNLLARLKLEPTGHNLSNPMWVQPFLFTVDSHPDLQLDPSEIVGSCWLELDRFRDESLHKTVELLPGKNFPAYPLADYYLWGFTYRLLRHVLNMDNPDATENIYSIDHTNKVH